MIRRGCSAILRLLLRVFFRRIEIDGADRVPSAGPIVLVSNHPNGLMDPLFLLCFSPRPVFFLAKAPLFRMPFVGFFVRAFECIPVYRRQDPGSDVARNRETFVRARELLARGGALALFPEGASHDEPRLLAVKTGAARITLGVVSEEGLRIVPSSLYYTWKSRFRSSALLSFGEPLPVAPVTLDERGEPPARETRELTRRIEAALSDLTLQAETLEALDLVRRAERIFSIDEEDRTGVLSEQLDRRRRFVAGAALLARRDPARFASLASRIARFEAERRAAGLPIGHLAPEALAPSSLTRLAARNAVAILLAPLAVAGALLHYPAYRLAGFLADQFARGQEDQVATIKAISAMLLFPATWVFSVAAAGILFGLAAAVAAAVLVPASGYAALRARESLDILVGRARALLFVMNRRSSASRLLEERRAIREEILRIGLELELTPSGDPAS